MAFLSFKYEISKISYAVAVTKVLVSLFPFLCCADIAEQSIQSEQLQE
jgi:hypothetical protein